MNEVQPDVSEEIQDIQPPTAEELARQAIWHEFLSPLHEHLHAQGISFGEHTGSHYDRYAHLPHFVDFITKQSGEKATIEASFPQKSRRSPIAGRPTRIINPTNQISELLKPLRDDDLRLDKTKRSVILQRAKETYRESPSILYGLALHEAIDKETSFGEVTLDAVAALTLAVEKIRRQQKAS